MSEKRFTVMKKFDGSYVICDKGKMLVADDCCDLLNEQQAVIEYLTIEKHQADKRFQTIIAELKKENEQLRKELKEIKENPINYF